MGTIDSTCAWTHVEFEKGERKLNGRVDGQLVLNKLSLIVNTGVDLVSAVRRLSPRRSEPPTLLARVRGLRTQIFSTILRERLPD
ncbi:MAG: hypothetical protein ACREMQ_07425 [Longimicrobiales bacterium]